MNLTTLSKLAVVVALSASLLTACGGGDDPPENPEAVVERALSRESLLAGPSTEARVEVASLGYEDRVLEKRDLLLEPGPYREIKRALSVRPDGAGTDRDPSGPGGLAGLVTEFEGESPTEIDGTKVEHVSGELDIEMLTKQLREASGGGDSLGFGEGGLPGLAEIRQLEQTLIGARFDLFAAEIDGSLERLDLSLSLDDPGNALPPTRIRLSLTEPFPGSDEAPS